MVPNANEHSAHVANDKADKVEGDAPYRAPEASTACNLFGIAFGCGPRLNGLCGLENAKIRGRKKGKGEGNKEHKEANNAECIECCLDLPDLVITIAGNGFAKCAVKEVYAKCNYVS